MEAIAKLKQMIGGEYMYGDDKINITGVSRSGDKIIIATATSFIDIEENEVDDFISDLQPAPAIENKARSQEVILSDRQPAPVPESKAPIQEVIVPKTRPAYREVAVHPYNAAITEYIEQNKASNKELREILMDNIRKVQADKEFIPQAAAINEQLKSIIDMRKTEVDVLKLLK